MAVISAYVQDRDNNLNLLRILAAFGVLVSHAYPIALGPEAVQPLKAEIGITLGHLSVYVFFVISGFLITQSFDRSSSVGGWLAGRGLRLFPGLIVVVVLTALVLGPAVTTLPLDAYFAQPEVPTYVLKNVTLAKLQFGLPGVFETHPYPVAINGSLWTLFHEVACYGFVFLLGVAGMIRSDRLLKGAMAAVVAAMFVYQVSGLEAVTHPRLVAFLGLAFPFAIGMCAYAWRTAIPLNWALGLPLVLAAWAALETPLFTFAFTLALAYWIFLLSFLPKGPIRAYNRIGDYSYGVYVYAFPIQQLVVWAAGPVTPLENMLLATPPVLLLSVLSWHLIESPSLGQRKRFGGLIDRAFRRVLPASRSAKAAAAPAARLGDDRRA